MSAEVSNRDILNVLMGMKDDIATVKANGANMLHSFNAHVVSDEALAKRVQSLELTRAATGGKASVWALLATAIGSLIGAAGAYFARH